LPQSTWGRRRSRFPAAAASPECRPLSTRINCTWAVETQGSRSWRSRRMPVGNGEGNDSGPATPAATPGHRDRRHHALPRPGRRLGPSDSGRPRTGSKFHARATWPPEPRWSGMQFLASPTLSWRSYARTVSRCSAGLAVECRNGGREPRSAPRLESERGRPNRPRCIAIGPASSEYSACAIGDPMSSASKVNVTGLVQGA